MKRIAPNTLVYHWLLRHFEREACLRSLLLASTREVSGFARDAMLAQLRLVETNDPCERLRQGRVLEELTRLGRLATFPNHGAKRSEAQSLQDLFARLCALERCGSRRLFCDADKGRLDPDVRTMIELMRSSIVETKRLALELLLVLSEERT